MTGCDQLGERGDDIEDWSPASGSDLVDRRGAIIDRIENRPQMRRDDHLCPTESTPGDRGKPERDQHIVDVEHRCAPIGQQPIGACRCGITNRTRHRHHRAITPDRLVDGQE